MEKLVWRYIVGPGWKLRPWKNMTNEKVRADTGFRLSWPVWLIVWWVCCLVMDFYRHEGIMASTFKIRAWSGEWKLFSSKVDTEKWMIWDQPLLSSDAFESNNFVVVIVTFRLYQPNCMINRRRQPMRKLSAGHVWAESQWARSAVVRSSGS